MDLSYTEEKQALDWNPQGAEGEEGRGPFCRKQENAAKQGARLRGWLVEMLHKWRMFLIGRKDSNHD
jgi:hypothetical protein